METSRRVRLCRGTAAHPGCGRVRKINARELCTACYQRHQKDGFIEPSADRGRCTRLAVCAGCGEQRPHFSKGKCRQCYRKAHPPRTTTCKACGEVRPHQALGLCTPCYMREDRNTRARRQTLRRSMLKQNYGLTEEQEASMRDAQGDACAVCRQLFTSTPRVDHCHATGAVRGLLCHKCNVGLGVFDDDPERLRHAADYLERAKSSGA
jgi:hypothetical protein